MAGASGGSGGGGPCPRSRGPAPGTGAKRKGHYPDDPELLFLAGNLARERRDHAAAEDFYRRVVGGSDGEYFASVDAGLRAVRARHNLAVLLSEQGRAGEAEGVWRAALTHDPHFLPARVGLGELYLKAGNAAGATAESAALRELGPEGAAGAAVLEARGRTAAGDHAGAAALLEAAAKEFPGSVGVRVALSHARLACGSPPDVLEAALRAVLDLDPANPQARHNLRVLMRNTGRWVEGVIDPPPGGGSA